MSLDPYGLAAGVGMPARILWAAGGRFPRRIFEELARRMGDARVEDVDASHLVPMEHPELVIDAVSRLCGPARERPLASARG